jgi:hypothetical protein
VLRPRGQLLTALAYRVVSLPYTSNGLQITPYGQSVQLVAKQLELELVVMWGPDTHLMVRAVATWPAEQASGGAAFLRQVPTCPTLPGNAASPHCKAVLAPGQQLVKTWVWLVAPSPHLKKRIQQGKNSREKQSGGRWRPQEQESVAPPIPHGAQQCPSHRS